MLIPIAPERFEEVQRALREEAAATAPAPDVNAENALHLAEPETLEFDRHSYHVPPPSGTEGLRLMVLVDEYQKASQQGAAAFQRAQYRLLDYMWRLATPRGFSGYVWRALLPNPFRRATTQEVGHLLDFFAQRQTTSRVRFRFMKEASRRPQIGSN